MTESDCLALIARGADRIAQWRRANAQARKDEAAQAERAAFWRAIDTSRRPVGDVLAFRKGGSQ
jgi:hypothetical protein